MKFKFDSRQVSLRLKKKLNIRGELHDEREVGRITAPTLFGQKLQMEVYPLEGLHKLDSKIVTKMLEEAISLVLDQECSTQNLDFTLPCFNIVPEIPSSPPEVAYWLEEWLFLSLIEKNPNFLTGGKRVITSAKLLDTFDMIENHSGTLKLKISPENIDDQIEWIQSLDKNNDCVFRFDGNRKLTKDQVHQISTAIDPKKIDFFEEPTIERIDHIPWAFDESTPTWLEADEYPVNLNALVIKPGVDILLHQIFKFLRTQRQKRNIPPAIISSYYQSRMGMRVPRILAHMQNSIKPVCSGLGTVDFIKG